MGWMRKPVTQSGAQRSASRLVGRRCPAAISIRWASRERRSSMLPAVFLDAMVDAAAQNQRGALALLNGRIYVPFGCHFGDCSDYHGVVVAVNVDPPQ